MTFGSLPLAHRFKLDFYANQVTSSGGDARHAKTLLFDTIDYDRFQVQSINEFRLKRTELQVKWSLAMYYEKLIDRFEVFFGGEIFSTKKKDLVLPVAACGKNYTINIRCISVDGFIGANVTYRTKMHDDDVPLSSLENRIQSEQKKESVTISWSPIKEEEPCIAYYEINFNDNVFKTNKTETEINDFAPCITYEIDITPVSTSENYGISSTYEFTSQEFCESM